MPDSMSWLVVRLAAVVAVLLCGQWRRWPLELTLLLAAGGLCLSYGHTPLDFMGIAMKGCSDAAMFSILAALLSIMTLSSLMDSTGQTRRLSEIARGYIASPRLRLAFFPALIGLIPMPGGAIFSCPMVQELSTDMPVTDRHRAMINLWFRHLWECVWPLYPGFVLACLLIEVSPLDMIASTIALLPCSIGIGWILFLRRIPRRGATAPSPSPKTSSRHALRELLPILTGIGIAFAVNALSPIPAGYAFCVGFLVATAICAWQNDVPARDLLPCICTRRSLGIFGVVVAVFVFKAVLDHCDMVTAIGAFARDNRHVLMLTFVVVPFLGGMFTGLQLGAVGMAFPILIPLLRNAGMWDDRAAWFALGAMMCYVGQMLSPIHVCFIVTAKYFRTPLGGIILRMLPPATALACCAVGIFLAKHVLR